MLFLTHLLISPILNAAELMIHLLKVTQQSQAKGLISTRSLCCSSSAFYFKPFLECNQSTGSEDLRVTSGDSDVTWEFQCKLPIHMWFIQLTSFLDESSTSPHFEVLHHGEDGQMIFLKAFFFAFSRGCFHFTI